MSVDIHHPGNEAAAGPNPPVAKKSSFYTAMRILPARQRDAMYQIYAFCRAVDDIADGDDPVPDRSAALEDWRSDIRKLYANGIETARTHGLAAVVAGFGVKEADFIAMIDGMEMDAMATIQAPDWQTLDLYCDRVASAAGRLSVKIFGIEDGLGETLSHHLGRALQLTNILRDLDEDAEMDRLYLPREDLIAAGIPIGTPRAVVADPRIESVCLGLAKKAAAHFEAASAVMDRCPRPTVKSPRIMAAAYRTILDRLLQRGWAAPRHRVRMSRRRVLLAALLYGIV